MDQWIECFSKCVSKTEMSLLILDNFSVHCTNSTHSKLSSIGTCVEMLPPNFTSKLQPLDFGLNKPFKDRLKNRWVQHMIDRETTEKTTRQILSNWIADAWFSIPETAITNTIRHIGYSDQ